MAGDIGDVANMRGCKDIQLQAPEAGAPTTEVVAPHHHTTSMEATHTCVCDGGRQHSNTDGDCETWCHDELASVLLVVELGVLCARFPDFIRSRNLPCHQIQQRGVLGLRPS